MSVVIKGLLVPDSVIDKFWERVRITKPDECWIWQGGLNSKKQGFDYGLFWIPKVGKYLAHRLAVSFELGYEVRSEDVRHSCDNPPCCNPNHLIPGSHKENMEDRKTRDRAVFEKGEDRYNAKLNDDLVRWIRRIHRLHLKYKKYTKAEIARTCGVHQTLIKRIIDRKAWSHVEDEK